MNNFCGKCKNGYVSIVSVNLFNIHFIETAITLLWLIQTELERVLHRDQHKLAFMILTGSFHTTVWTVPVL